LDSWWAKQLAFPIAKEPSVTGRHKNVVISTPGNNDARAKSGADK
jgi:hypothetical protein